MIMTKRQAWLGHLGRFSLLMLAATAVASCDGPQVEPLQTPHRTATVSPGSPAAIGGVPCALVTAEEVGELVGLPSPASVGDGPTDCIFMFTPLGQTSAESVSVFLIQGQGVALSGTPVPGLGETAVWSQSSSQLQVQLPHAVMSIYVQLPPEKAPQQQLMELAARIFQLAEPRVP